MGEYDNITPDRRLSETLILSTNVDKIVRNRVYDCHGTHKHCFYRFLIRVRRLFIAFSIPAYPV